MTDPSPAGLGISARGVTVSTVGLVRVKTTGVNQHGIPVIEFKRSFMVWKRGHAPGTRPSS